MPQVVGVVGAKFGYSNEECLICVQYTQIVVDLSKKITSTFLFSNGFLNIVFYSNGIQSIDLDFLDKRSSRDDSSDLFSRRYSKGIRVEFGQNCR
jgi:hypothetical protein